MTTFHTPDTMTPEQLATYLCVTKQTLLRWRRKGYGPAYLKVSNRTIRYRLADVQEWEDRLRGNE